MSALAFWLLFVGLLPIAYWSLKLLFSSIWEYFSPAHKITLSVELANGHWVQKEIDVSSDQEFYKIARAISKDARKISGDS